MERTCKTCGAYWKNSEECRRHAPEPMASSNIKQVPHKTMWLKVDGKGCHEWVPANAAPAPEPPTDELEDSR